MKCGSIFKRHKFEAPFMIEGSQKIFRKCVCGQHQRQISRFGFIEPYYAWENCDAVDVSGAVKEEILGDGLNLLTLIELGEGKEMPKYLYKKVTVEAKDIKTGAEQ
jgi:hypothetical protein